jgi:hypothetical protein
MCDVEGDESKSGLVFRHGEHKNNALRTGFSSSGRVCGFGSLDTRYLRMWAKSLTVLST